jgi:hypothetical protein
MLPTTRSPRPLDGPFVIIGSVCAVPIIFAVAGDSFVAAAWFIAVIDWRLDGAARGCYT